MYPTAEDRPFGPWGLSFASDRWDLRRALVIEGRAKDTGDWMERSRALIDAASVALEAARNKDAAAVFDSGEGIYFACEGCHQQYRYDDGPSTMR